MPHGASVAGMNDEGFWIDQSVLLGPRSDMEDILRAFEKVHENRGLLRDWAMREIAFMESYKYGINKSRLRNNHSRRRSTFCTTCC